MLRPNHLRFRTWVFVGAAILLFCRVSEPAQQQSIPVPEFSFTVVVKEAATGDHISQARLTLTFRRTGKLHRTVTYGSKTNSQVRYRFTYASTGALRFIVTADR